jgi:hypothetical protein
MSHSLVKSILVPEIVRMIAEKYRLSEDDALKAFYQSGTARALGDDETGLYSQSPWYIFSFFEEEYEKNLFSQKIR